MSYTGLPPTKIVDPNPYLSYKKTQDDVQPVHNPGTLFGHEDHGVDPAIPDLVRKIAELEEENTTLREQLQDCMCDLQKHELDARDLRTELEAKNLKLRRLQNVALQSKRAVGKLMGFMEEHIQ